MEAINLSDEEKKRIQEKLDTVHWFHKFEILPGIFTPGRCPAFPKKMLDNFGVPENLEGVKVLEIATFDGAYAFELERRGATVTALDIQPPDLTGFNISKEILKSNVTYVEDSVYNLTNLFDVKFDIILFLGVFYHLKAPVLAFEQVRSVLADIGVIYFEGECLRHFAENLDHTPSDDHSLIQQMANSDIPIALNYPGTYKNGHNWAIPNLACVKSWIAGAGLKLEAHNIVENPNSKDNLQRISGVLKRDNDKDIQIEHSLREKKTV